MAPNDLASEFQTSTAGRAEVLEDIKNWLELDKLVVIRAGWKLPETFESARRAYYDETSIWQGGKENEPRYKAKRAAFDEQVALASDSLRNFIAQQNKEVADSLSAEDLRSLVRLGHVTLRSASTQPVSAVIVFDPLEDGASPDKDWALKQFFIKGKFADAWSEDKPAEKLERLPVADFIENFDINPLDLYAHKVLMRVHYALRHQNQLANLPGRLDEERTKPQHLSFTQQTEYGYVAEYTPYYAQKENSPEAQTNAEVAAFRYLNRYIDPDDKVKPAFGKDDNFYYKLVRLEAGASIFPLTFGDEMETLLRRLAAEPGQGWMRYYGRAGEEIERGGLTREQTETIRKEFTEKFVDALKKDRPEEEKGKLDFFGRIFDLRVLVPSFRKLYEADESKGTPRAALNIIKQGLEKYFPTLLAAPIPGWTKESEPPKTASGYKKTSSIPAAEIKGP